MAWQDGGGRGAWSRPRPQWTRPRGVAGPGPGDPRRPRPARLRSGSRRTGWLEPHGAERPGVRVGGGPVAADQGQPIIRAKSCSASWRGASGFCPARAQGAGRRRHTGRSPRAGPARRAAGSRYVWRSRWPSGPGRCGDEVGQLVRPGGGRVGQGHVPGGVHVERHHVVDQVVARWDDRGLGHTGQGVAGLGRPQAAGLIVRVGLERDRQGVLQAEDDAGPGGVVGPAELVVMDEDEGSWGSWRLGAGGSGGASGGGHRGDRMAQG